VGGDIIRLSTASLDCSLALKDAGYTVIPESEKGFCDLVVSDGERLIPHLLETLRSRGVEVDTVSLKKPTLDDVFLKYTGARIDEGESWTAARQARRAFRRFAG